MTADLTTEVLALYADLHEPHWHADQHKCRAFLMTEDCTCGGRDRLAAIEAAARQPLLDRISAYEVTLIECNERIAALEGKHSSYCSSQAGPGEDCVVCNPRARRIAALEAALPEDPWLVWEGYRCYSCDAERKTVVGEDGIWAWVDSHKPDCKWVSALAGTGR